nr:enoyl-CoA hydratase-related protein [Acidimicrobiales bacterium]
MGDVVLYEESDGVALVTLNRPERLNSWTDELGSEYFDALDRGAASSDVQAIVVTGAGRGFCSGADMDMLQGIGAGKDDQETQRQLRAERHDYALTIPKPVIAAINGACAGLGFVHAMMCDIRFAAEGAKFTSAFSRRGLIAEHGVSYMLPRVVGPSNALDILMSGRVFLADEAKEMGVVSRVVPPDELVP